MPFIIEISFMSPKLSIFYNNFVDFALLHEYYTWILHMSIIYEYDMSVIYIPTTGWFLYLLLSQKYISQILKILKKSLILVKYPSIITEPKCHYWICPHSHILESRFPVHITGATLRMCWNHILLAVFSWVTSSFFICGVHCLSAALPHHLCIWKSFPAALKRGKAAQGHNGLDRQTLNSDGSFCLRGLRRLLLVTWDSLLDH